MAYQGFARKSPLRALKSPKQNGLEICPYQGSEFQAANSAKRDDSQEPARRRWIDLNQLLRLYFPSRTIFLLLGELTAILLSFSLAILIRFHSGTLVVFASSFWKILVVTSLTLLCAYYMELYDRRGLSGSWDTCSRILKLVGVVALVLAAFSLIFPRFLLERKVSFVALFILTPAWMIWRTAYDRLIFHPAFRQRVYLIGGGELALRVRNTLVSRRELGMDIVGWSRYPNEETPTEETLEQILCSLAMEPAVERVIVALSDRRSRMPVNELLQLRLRGVVIEEGTSVLEKVSGQIEVDELRPSWLIFGDGFRLRPKHWIARRLVSTLSALILTVGTIVFVPLIALLIKLTSKGHRTYVGQRRRSTNYQGWALSTRNSFGRNSAAMERFERRYGFRRPASRAARVR
jgi:hypothetical protein